MTPEEALRAVLQQRGIDWNPESGEPGLDAVGIQLKIRTHLAKYDGPAPKPGEDKQPVEYLVFEDGKCVQHEINGVPVPLGAGEE